MSDFLDTPAGSMNFDPSRPRPKGGGAATPAGSGTPTPPPAHTTTPPPSSASYDLNGQPLWGTAGGMVYQYGRDSTGRDTFGPATDEAGNPLGNQDNLMIGSQDPRYGAAQAALAKYPGYTQVRVNQQGAYGGYLDPSQLVYDPTVGLITPIGNIQQAPDHTGTEILAMMIGGPLLGAAGNAIAGAGDVAGAGIAGASPALETGGYGTGVGVAGSGLPGGAAGAAGAGVGATAVPPLDPTVPPGPDAPPPPPDGAPPPVAGDPTGLNIPPPMDPVTAPTLDPMVPPYDPAAVADGFTPTINDMVTPPPTSGVDGPVGFPTDTGPYSSPDFNVPMQAPPDVTVPPPDVSIDTPWWQAGLDAVTSHPLQTAGLGLTAFNALNRPKPPSINSNIPDTNKPVIDQAIGDIMNKGALSGDQKGSIDGIIDRHIREGVEALTQRAVNSGMGANSMVTQEQINQFKQNAETVREQMYQQQMQQNIGNAISVWAEGNREDIAIQTAAANLAMENNREVAQLNTSIAQSLGWLYSMGNSRSTPTTLPGG